MRHLQERLFSPLKADIFEEALYSSEQDFIGHRILRLDESAESVPDSVYQRLDEVVAKVRAEVTIPNVSTVEEARLVLTQIEQVITSLNFVCSIPYFLVHSFSQGLSQQALRGTYLAQTPENSLRKTHIIANQDQLFSHVDCDLGTLLYLTIGEDLGLPLCMVEVPRHNFIRWRFGADNHLNWDTNYGFSKFTNQGYTSRYGVTADHIAKGTYLVDLSIEETEGYFCFVRGITFERGDLIDEAIQQYREATAKYARSPSSRNNIAWMFVSKRQAQQSVTGEEALRFATEACSIDRSHSYLDTLACVLAENGDFQQAIQIETEAYSIEPSPGYLQMIEAFRQRQTWLDVHG